MAVVYILEPGTESMEAWDSGFVGISDICGLLRYVHVAYVKISSEGVGGRIWFSNPTRYLSMHD